MTRLALTVRDPFSRQSPLYLEDLAFQHGNMIPLTAQGVESQGVPSHLHYP